MSPCAITLNPNSFIVLLSRALKRLTKFHILFELRIFLLWYCPCSMESMCQIELDDRGMAKKIVKTAPVLNGTPDSKKN